MQKKRIIILLFLLVFAIVLVGAVKLIFLRNNSPGGWQRSNPSGICGNRYCANGSLINNGLYYLPYQGANNITSNSNYSMQEGYVNNSDSGGYHSDAINITPELDNLGVDFEPFNSSSGYAGSFKFDEGIITHNPSHSVVPGINKVFLEYGIQVKNGNGEYKTLPHYTYVLPYGTNITAVSKMRIDIIAYQPDSNDYEIQGAYESDNGSISSWRIDYDHITGLSDSLMAAFNNAKNEGKITSSSISSETASVKVNVNSGDILGESSGVIELMVFYPNNQTTITTYCPIALMNSNVSGEYKNKVNSLENDWEKYTGDMTLYNPSNEVLPGCLYNTIYV